MTYQLVASPYPDGHLVVSPGRAGGIQIGTSRYAELRDATPAGLLPDWLTAAARAAWGLDLVGQAAESTIIVRPETEYGYARASYEVNLGCNYDFFWIKRSGNLDWLLGSLRSWRRDRTLTGGWKIRGRLMTPSLTAMQT